MRADECKDLTPATPAALVSMSVCVRQNRTRKCSCSNHQWLNCMQTEDYDNLVNLDEFTEGRHSARYKCGAPTDMTT